MKLVFEHKSASTKILPDCDVPVLTPPENLRRKSPPQLPEIAESELIRHYSRLSDEAFGVNRGFYPLGSCTMKYNPKINEEIAGLFADIHPLQPDYTARGCIDVLEMMERFLREITGMDAVSLQPAAGAHGELAGLLMIKACHKSRGENLRTKIIVPDSAHGTNPASAAMAGFTCVNLASRPDGRIDPEHLKKLAGPDIAGLMLTNPNTYGLFEKDIAEISKIVHDMGGLLYYDGANLNAIMGAARPGDMGFDVVHLNLHKTFATPHGGGGPGSGPVGCKAELTPFLPHCAIKGGGSPESIGQMRSFFGNFAVIVKAMCYILSLGGQGLADSAAAAVLNANYLKSKLSDALPAAFPGLCMHEFAVSCENLKKETGVSALDAAKAMIDKGMHPPTMYFPLTVAEALMFEPTETETKDTLDEAAAAILEILETAKTSPDALHSAPVSTRIGRVDEVNAARNPILTA